MFFTKESAYIDTMKTEVKSCSVRTVLLTESETLQTACHSTGGLHT